ncbi:MAG: 4-(cytidine 5'-diphospho)-2-C-methyl-D-erythritol kinase [Bacteroidales bacterium]|jgi:4-diphosphocytidyl-2-C-methyl-D-erythritol kinase|nr:4-(cytidine 5'-diphospho)-2-C-methyl-D-erythritol kinase [Bacteroidales bacterium]
MTVYPNAKINIGLWVTGKRPDGYHDIVTVFYPVALCDTLEIELSGNEKPAFSCAGTGLMHEPPAENLCCKAYRLLDEAYGLPPARISLHKHIPTGAGLGGGSSDAAFTLRTLNKLCRLRLSEALLAEHAAQLGSDCAFFLHRKPALGTGKGDVLHPLPLSLAPYRILLAKPPVAVSTAEAYARVQPVAPRHHLPDLLQLPVTEWRRCVTNDFESPIFAVHPEIADIKRRMYDLGAVYASMSGSGSVVYGIFERLPSRKAFEETEVWRE